MTERRIRIGLLLAAWLAWGNAWGEISMLGGVLDGAEATTAPLAEADCREAAVGYEASTFTVSAAGTYHLVNAYRQLEDSGAPAVYLSVYVDRHDPAQPGLNRVLNGAEYPWEASAIELRTDRQYVLVAQQACARREGHWAALFRGPGTLHSERRVALESFTSGSPSTADPAVVLESCGEGLQRKNYKVFSARAPVSGSYYFSDAFGSRILRSVCLSVYRSGFSPQHPSLNLVTSLSYAGTVELRAGEVYYFVLTAHSGNNDLGEYQFLLAPPAPLRINAGMADAWYNPDVPGQGLVLDVLERRNALFLGWLTFQPGSPPGLAAPQQWLTAFGPFADAHADLALQWVAGASADPAAPPAVEVVGQVELEFQDCRAGQVTYAFDDSGRQGSFPIRRLREDTVALCEAEVAGPGLPGAFEAYLPIHQ